MPPFTSQGSDENGGRLRARLSLVVLAVALGLANLPSGGQESIAGLVRGTVLRPFLAINQGRVAARNRAVEAAALQAEIDALTERLVATNSLAEENRRLRALLGLGQRMGPQWQAVQVLRPGVEERSILIVDRGEESGVVKDAPLITPEGLAGRIRESRRTQAVGMDWTHPDFAASAMTRDGLHFGLVRSQRGLFPGQARLILDGVPYYAEVEPGTDIVTSGVGGTFPRGIPIGRVVEEEETEGRWRKSFVLKPFVEPGSVTLALVGLPGLQAQAAVDSAWGQGDLLRADERLVRDQLLLDSLRILRDSLGRLQEQLGGGPGVRGQEQEGGR
jgi:rod shape-determining protein MreC